MVFSVKSDGTAPLANVESVSVTVNSAPSRFPSVSVAGRLVIAAVGSTTVMVNISTARSPSFRLMSPSCAYTVTVAAPAVFLVGVPHTVRAAQFGAPKESPAGRPLAE